MYGQSICHDGYEFGMDFILVLLIILADKDDQMMSQTLVDSGTHPLEFIKLDQNNGLFGIQVAPHEFAEIWRKGYDDRQALRGQRCK